LPASKSDGDKQSQQSKKMKEFRANLMRSSRIHIRKKGKLNKNGKGGNKGG
jgi:hypothetical protein